MLRHLGCALSWDPLHAIASGMHRDHVHHLHQALRIDHDLCHSTSTTHLGQHGMTPMNCAKWHLVPSVPLPHHHDQTKCKVGLLTCPLCLLTLVDTLEPSFAAAGMLENAARRCLCL